MNGSIDQSARVQAQKPPVTVEALNETFKPYGYIERLRRIYDLFDPDDLFVTSSFGTQSIFLLDLIRRIKPDQTIHFIDTGYHFPETLAYKEAVIERFNLQVIDIHPERPYHDLTKSEAWWTDHPRMCCTINKLAPIEPILSRYKIWISGLMASQSAFRAYLNVFESQGDIIKFHPLIDVSSEEFRSRLAYYDLPKHPLEAAGYGSIGCTHCTQKGMGRDGRWSETTRSECGLHTRFYYRQNESHGE